MIRAIIDVIGVTAACLIFIVAPGLPQWLVRFSRAFGVYAALGLPVRATILLLANPEPRFGDKLPVVSLSYPSYQANLGAVLPLAILGLSSFYLAMYAIGRIAMREPSRTADTRISNGAYLTLYLVGWIARLTYYMGALGSSGLLAHFMVLPTVTLGVLVLSTDWRADAKIRNLVGFGLALELAYAFIATSKTPVLAVLLILYLDPRRDRIRLKQTLLAAVAIFLAFGVVQSLKVQDRTGQVRRGAAADLAVDLESRVDVLVALGGVHELGPGQYLPPDEVVSRGISDLAPSALLGGGKTLSGVTWGQRVYGSETGASYAEGLTPEGYGTLGTTGVALWNLIGGVAAALSCAALRCGSVALKGAAASIIFSAAIFERGLLGLAEACGVAVQLALVIQAAVVLSRRPSSEAVEAHETVRTR